MPEDSELDSNEKSVDFDAADSLSTLICVIVLILPLIALEKINPKVDRSSNGKRTQWLIKAVIVSNTVFAMYFLSRMIVCWHCASQWVLFFGLKWVTKLFNLLFLVHRAKLSQGMTPILSKKWFEKILPRFIVVNFFIFMAGSTFSTALKKEYVCEAYNDTDSIHFCWFAGGLDVVTRDQMIGAAIFLGFDVVITVLLLTLFVVPLYRVYSLDLGAMNDNQLRQRNKLRALVVWSVALCLINQVTSTVHLLPIFGQSKSIWVLNSIGKFDPAINVWTSWLMITRNRQILWKHINRWFGRTLQSEQSLAQSVITDDSANSNNKRVLRASPQRNVLTRNVSDIELMIEAVRVSNAIKGVELL